MPRTAALLPSLVIGTLALTACSAAPAGPRPETTSAAKATSTAPPTTAPTTPPTTARPKPTGADGTNLAACQDGSCDVLVTGPATIPVPPRTGFLSLQVVRVGTTLGIRWTSPGGGGGSMAGSGRGHLAEGTDFEFSDLGDGTAVLRIHPS
ncbi:hypothetical protein WEH80_34035 [Actinomycetes bacterium KLBMP 9759]